MKNTLPKTDLPRIKNFLTTEEYKLELAVSKT